ncbi:MAG: hypothetical protein OIN86_14445 [Candidatus Methanoperedens sp.]|nr:hypothetical protein [Candidatus Methanoperedens sp.]CAG1007948.1 hypothetical protein METP1_03525 [Methanosarcinales archaeon]
MSITPEMNTDKSEAKELIRDWIKTGRGNPWIKYVCDPPFNEMRFKGYIERLLAATREQCLKLEY